MTISNFPQNLLKPPRMQGDRDANREKDIQLDCRVDEAQVTQKNIGIIYMYVN